MMRNLYLVKAVLVTTLTSKQDWIDRVPECLPVDVAHRELLFIDKNGYVLTVGDDFDSAEEKNSYPVSVIHLTRINLLGKIEPNGIELIAQERDEQIEKHNRTILYDIQVNFLAQLRDAAIMLLGGFTDNDCDNDVPYNWNEEKWNKLLKKPLIERIQIAGAFCAAEIDRLQNIKKEGEK